MTKHINEIMTRNVKTIGPETTLIDAAREMRELDIGFMPVCDGERVVGTVTDRDITIRGVARGLDPNSTPISDVMNTGHVLFCFDDEDLEQAARLMRDAQIRRLPVMNREKKLVGVVALADVARAADERLSGETLGGVSTPAE